MIFSRAAPRGNNLALEVAQKKWGGLQPRPSDDRKWKYPCDARY
jgi:hypothetical protein